MYDLVFLEESGQHPISSSVSLGSEESHHHRSIKLPAAVLPLLNVSVDTKTAPQKKIKGVVFVSGVSLPGPDNFS